MNLHNLVGILSVVLIIRSCQAFNFPSGWVISSYRNYFVMASIISSSNSMSPDSSADSRQQLSQTIQKALEVHKAGELDQAVTLYESVLSNSVVTGNLAGSLHNNVAAIYMNKGDYESAKSHFIRAIDSDSSNPQSHFNLAVILTTKFDQHSKALRYCRAALKLDPKMYKAMHLMGNILQNLGQDAEAESYFVMAEHAAQEQQGGGQPATSTSSGTVGTTGKLEPKYNWNHFPIMQSKMGSKYTVSDPLGSQGNITMECVSERPLVFRVSGLMSSEECSRIKERASPQLQKSFVMGKQNRAKASVDAYGESSSVTDENQVEGEGGVEDEPYRSSFNAWLPADDVATVLQKRFAAITGFPIQLFQQRSEELQVVKYESGGQFKVHQDSSGFHKRFLTALLYLNDVDEGCGGETWFPFSGEYREFDLSVEEAISTALESRSREGKAGDNEGAWGLGIKIAPKMGDAVVFFNHLTSGELDPAAVHAGLPVQRSIDEVEGKITEKWIANYWVDLDFDVLFAGKT
jgi:tetratricopeptide (TPR) repeat protein